jgi:DNA-binding beta-propeller fold protein YncE
MNKIHLSLLGFTIIFIQLSSVQAQHTTDSMAAVSSEKGNQDVFGAYDVDANWPLDLTLLEGHENWTFGAGQSIFAENSNRIFALQRGELPAMQAPAFRTLNEIGPSLSFPNGPWRNATRAALPANGGTSQNAERGITDWIARGGRLGIDARWEHCILIFNSEGELVDAWPQWDSMLQRPHHVVINPNDPEKHVWIVDDHKHVIHKFTNDGSTLVQTIGTYGESGADEAHFNRPAFMAFMADGSFVVADGYNGTRVVKFDADGNYITSWGEAGNPPDETRPGYFNNVHGVAVDPETNNIFVNDRGNQRIQVFNENGSYLYEWNIGPSPANLHMFIITPDRYLWAADRSTNKIIKYDLEGNFLYAFGTSGDFPGGLRGVHGLAVDEDGNLYVAEVDNGGFQKFVPREGANPDFLITGSIPSTTSISDPMDYVDTTDYFNLNERDFWSDE